MSDAPVALDAPPQGGWIRALVGGAALAGATLGLAAAACGIVAGAVALVAGGADGEWGPFLLVLALVAILATTALALVALAVGRALVAPCPPTRRGVTTAVWTAVAGVAWMALLRPGITQLEGAEAWAWMAPGLVTAAVGVAIGARAARPPAPSSDAS